MSSISSLIEVFKMNEISPEVRADIIVKLGHAINYEFASSVTEPIVYELVKLLNPDHKILKDEHYLRFKGEKH